MGRVIAVCLLALWIVPAEPVTAQGAPSVELSGGYALLGRLDVDTVTPTGLFGAGAWHLGRWVSLVGELGWHRQSETVGVDLPGVDRIALQDDVATLAGGPRWDIRERGAVRPFVEFLVGMRHERLDVTPRGPGGTVVSDGLEVSLASTDLLLQPGGGVTAWVRPRVGVQVSLHYRRSAGRSLLEMEIPEASELRLAVGVTIGLGGT